MMSNAHSLSQWEKFIRPLHLNYCSQSRFCFTALNLRPAEAIVLSISDAIFLLPVRRSSSPNVHSLS